MIKMGKRIISQNRGKGTSTYRSPPRRRKEPLVHPKTDVGETLCGEILDLIHDPARNSVFAKVAINMGDDKVVKPILAVEGNYVGQKIFFGDNAEIAVGNTLPLSKIPDGSLVCNIESKPGDGGKFVRSTGACATVISHEGDKTYLELPSGVKKRISSKCRATIGIVAGGGRKEKPFIKAGKRYYSLKSKAAKYPRTSAVKMNSVDHPFGGGGHKHVGKSKTVSRNTPPGKKVGSISAKKTGKRR